jgi:hypothetical protein
MPQDFDFYVSSNDSLLEFEHNHLIEDVKLNIINNENDPAETIFIILPKSVNNAINWVSKTILKGTSANLVINYRDDLNIQYGNFGVKKISDNDPVRFKEIMITDHKIINKYRHGIDIDEVENYNKTLTISNPRNEGLHLYGNKRNYHYQLLCGCNVQILL